MMEEMKRIITEWCKSEYGSDTTVEFDNPHEVSILYSTDGDNEEWEVQVYLDLVNLTFNYYYDRKLVSSLSYTESEFMDELRYLDWQSEYEWCVDHGRSDEE